MKYLDRVSEDSKTEQSFTNRYMRAAGIPWIDAEEERVPYREVFLNTLMGRQCWDQEEPAWHDVTRLLPCPYQEADLCRIQLPKITQQNYMISQ